MINSSTILTRRGLLRLGANSIAGCAIGYTGVKYAQPALSRYFFPRPEPAIIVDCSANPDDMRLCARAIMEAENYILDSIPDDTPLAILLGEHHYKPSNVTAGISVLEEYKSLHRNFNDLAFGFELPPSSFENESLRENALYKVNDTRESSQAPLSRGLVYDYLDRHSIDIAGLDFEREIEVGEDSNGKFYYHTLLDQEDNYNQSLVERFAPEMIGKPINRGSRFPSKEKDIGDNSIGLKLSNISMAERALHKVKKNNKKVIIISTGAAHIFGDNYEDGLSHQLNMLGFKTLNCLLSKNQEIPHDAKDAMNNTIIAKGLNGEWSIDKVLDSREKEMAVLGRLNAASGHIFDRNTVGLNFS